jgi:hypothetical protein
MGGHSPDGWTSLCTMRSSISQVLPTEILVKNLTIFLVDTFKKVCYTFPMKELS